jgi:GDP-D-mannose dehydratase
MKQKKALITGIIGQDGSNPLRVYEADVDGD